jgi:hypothetical protein
MLATHKVAGWAKVSCITPTDNESGDSNGDLSTIILSANNS